MSIHLGIPSSKIPQDSHYQLGITFHSYDMTQGGATITRYTNKNVSTSKELAMTAAGPLTGFASLILMYKCLKTITKDLKPYSLNKAIALSIADWILTIDIYYAIINELWQLTPCGDADSDGQKIGKLMGMSDKTLKQCSSYSFVRTIIQQSIASFIACKSWLGYYTKLTQ